mgnify:CR=1 FL=1
MVVMPDQVAKRIMVKAVVPAVNAAVVTATMVFAVIRRAMGIAKYAQHRLVHLLMEPVKPQPKAPIHIISVAVLAATTVVMPATTNPIAQPAQMAMNAPAATVPMVCAAPLLVMAPARNAILDLWESVPTSPTARTTAIPAA